MASSLRYRGWTAGAALALGLAGAYALVAPPARAGVQVSVVKAAGAPASAPASVISPLRSYKGIKMALQTPASEVSRTASAASLGLANLGSDGLVTWLDGDTAIKLRIGAAPGFPGVEALVVDRQGKVGVGVPVPSERLDVGGGLRAEHAAFGGAVEADRNGLNLVQGDIEFNGSDTKITSTYVATDSVVAGKIKIGPDGWSIAVPDYVFADGYRPDSLAALEKYLKAHRHLPGVPSAAELGKGGMDLAEMNLRLLKQVEELTLYVIDQDKRIKGLEKRAR